MKINKINLLFLLLILFPSIVSANTYIEKTIDWHKVKVIKYELNSPDFNFKIWKNEENNATSLRTLMESENGISAVNWIYFCPADYSACGWKNFTINERYIEWKKYAWYESTWDRVVFALDKDNKPFLFQTNKINADKETEIYTWLWNFPLILQDWKNVIEYYREQWLIDKKMKASMDRNFICSDKEWKYLYFWYVKWIILDHLHAILTQIWCYNALNLDAWASSAMVYNSRYIVWPGRNIMDALIIERKWLDTKPLREKATLVIQKVEKYLKPKTLYKQKKYLDQLSNTLTKARSTIYEKNSKDLYDENWNIIWYEIETNSISTLKKLYLINYLDKLIYELEKKLIAEDKKKKSIKEPLF